MHFSTCACLSVRSQMSPAKYYFCCFSGCFPFQQMHGNNATHAIKFPSFFTKRSTASTLKTFHFACNCFLNIKVWMKSNLIGKKKKKTSTPLFLLPTVELLLYIQQDSCLILSQHDPFLDVWIKHLATFLRGCSANEHRRRQGVFHPV